MSDLEVLFTVSVESVWIGSKENSKRLELLETEVRVLLVPQEVSEVLFHY